MMCSSLYAQNFVGVEVGGQLPFMKDKISLTSSKVGFGGEVGFVYEWHRNHFMFQTGLQYALVCPQLRIEDQELEQAMLDTRGVPFIYRGSMAERTDRMCAGQLLLPLYIGGMWHGLYVLAGVKLGVNLHAKSVQKAQLKTAGDYIDRYYEWLENMPNHGYHDYLPVKSSHSMQLSLIDIRFGGELGYAFNLGPTNRRTQPPMMRIGLFAEYSALDMRSKESYQSTTPRTQPDYSQYMSVDMTHIYASQDAQASPANLITCGLRVTVLFPLRNPYSSNYNYPCRCLTDW